MISIGSGKICAIHCSDFDDQRLSCDMSTQTDETLDANLLVQKVAELERELKCNDDQITKQRFRLANIKDDDDSKVLLPVSSNFLRILRA